MDVYRGSHFPNTSYRNSESRVQITITSGSWDFAARRPDHLDRAWARNWCQVISTMAWSGAKFHTDIRNSPSSRGCAQIHTYSGLLQEVELSVQLDELECRSSTISCRKAKRWERQNEIPRTQKQKKCQGTSAEENSKQLGPIPHLFLWRDGKTCPSDAFQFSPYAPWCWYQLDTTINTIFKEKERPDKNDCAFTFRCLVDQCSHQACRVTIKKFWYEKKPEHWPRA